jgi:DNA adenine methylase
VTLPKSILKVVAPPLKCQGIKTKLVPFLAATIEWEGLGRWIEPFSGSSVVALNIAPDKASLFDANPHIIDIYQGIQQGRFNPKSVREFLELEGEQLRKSDGAHYYDVRARFNEHKDPLDYLFLNRACFNGLVRFNKKGFFNVPFCKKPDRFRPAYVTKIVNQITWVQRQIAGRDWQWKHGDWREALKSAKPNDFVYLDPPYIGRHSNYFNQWTEADAIELAERSRQLSCGLGLSMWLRNKYRENTHIDDHWSWASLHTTEHFYHVGSKETLRNSVTEALLVRP